MAQLPVSGAGFLKPLRRILDNIGANFTELYAAIAGSGGDESYIHTICNYKQGTVVTGDTADHVVFAGVVPGGLMGSDGKLCMEVVLHRTTNVAGAGAVWLRMNFGSLRFFNTNGALSSANIVSVNRGEIRNDGSSNAQIAYVPALQTGVGPSNTAPLTATDNTLIDQPFTIVVALINAADTVAVKHVRVWVEKERI